VFPWRPSLSTRAAYEATVTRMKWWLDRDLATTVVQRSQEALAAMDDGHLDWAYLDSSHQFGETLEELRLLKRKVKAKGVICGHDFKTGRHPGVFRAITAFLQESAEFRLVYLDTRDQGTEKQSG
jgi:hypothetical protein